MPGGTDIEPGKPGRYNVKGEIWNLPVRYELQVKIRCAEKLRPVREDISLIPLLSAQDLVGKGAYGSVCKAIDVDTRKTVAIKRIANVFVSKTDALRILREVTKKDTARPCCTHDPPDSSPSSLHGRALGYFRG